MADTMCDRSGNLQIELIQWDVLTFALDRLSSEARQSSVVCIPLRPAGQLLETPSLPPPARSTDGFHSSSVKN